jgi:hypothetical protein
VLLTVVQNILPLNIGFGDVFHMDDFPIDAYAVPLNKASMS